MMIFVILIQAQTSNQRVYPIYPSLDKSWLIGQKVCPEHLFTPLRTGTLSRDAIRPRQAPLPISAERRPRLP